MTLDFATMYPEQYNADIDQRIKEGLPVSDAAMKIYMRNREWIAAREEALKEEGVNSAEKDPLISEAEAVAREPILAERETTHGDYTQTAEISQNLKEILVIAMRENPYAFNGRTRESLDLICTKLARIVSGDPNNKDHWDDIAGYAKLVSEVL
jgi:hypothetical protein